jgi:predicted RNA methylase
MTPLERITEQTATLLRDATINTEDFSLQFNKQLERDDYARVDDVLSRLRGKWNKRANAHLFPFDPTGPLSQILESMILPDKNPTAFFPTPAKALDAMFSLVDDIAFRCADVERSVRVLEPSGGIGGIADFICSKTEHVQIDIVEILPVNQELLKSKGYTPFCMDFMDFEIPTDENKYDYVFMNPPFSLKGDKTAYITHINHALKMLKPSGELVAIVPLGWITNDNKKELGFRNLVASHGNHICTLEKGTFKESGTNIETRVITLYPREWKNAPINGWKTHHEWEFMLYATQEYIHHKAFDKLMNNTKTNNQDFQEFCLHVISYYAKKDIFLSTLYLDKYVMHLRKLWVESMEEKKEEFAESNDSFAIQKDIPNEETFDDTCIACVTNTISPQAGTQLSLF